MINRLFRRFLALVIIFLVVPISTARAGFEDEMKGLFDSMVNVTDGDYHKAMGRGVVAGPSVVVRNKRIRTDLINFTPPRFDAGCGGIDMFLGSFSFISGEQFVNLMQAIASNAGGYAFQLALSVMCPSCKQVMSNLQKVIQKMNQMAGDSCRIAQGLVDTAAEKLPLKELGQQIDRGPLGQAAMALGEGIGAFDTFLDKINYGTNTGKFTKDKVDALLGNIAWNVLTKNGYISSAFSSGGDELAEALMSVTGTIIGTKVGDDKYAEPKITTHPATLSFKDVMEGSSSVAGKKKYSCGGSTGQCLELTEVDYNYKGLQKFVSEVLSGDDTALIAGGLVAQLLTNSGPPSQQARQLIRIAPYHTTRLRNMAVCTLASGGVGSLERYAREASDLIALEVIEKYMRDMIAALSLAAAQSTNNVDGKMLSNALTPAYMQNLKDLEKEIKETHNILHGAKQQTLEQIYGASVANCNLKHLYIRNGG